MVRSERSSLQAPLSVARFARAVVVGVAHHVTQRGIDHQRVFFTDSDRYTYLDWMRT
jgi:hypothetical protein